MLCSDDLLDDQSYDHAGLKPRFYDFMGGCLASVIGQCYTNESDNNSCFNETLLAHICLFIAEVNPPEVRGAALTAANLIINAARGAGPSFLTTTLMGAFGVNRASGFNITVSC